MNDDWRHVQVSPRVVVAVILAFVVLIVVMAVTDGISRAPTASSEPPTASAAATQLGSGDRHIHLRNLITGLAPLFIGYDEVGPASVNLRIDPSVWSALTRDEQLQLMDDLASKQIVRDVGATLHLFVNSTEIGTIGPGWTGEWAFRRGEN
jgi:hypothetical protein